MKRQFAWIGLMVILCAGFFLREYRVMDFPYHGDEVDEGDIAVEILHGNLAPFYPQNEGNEALYQFVLAGFFTGIGESVVAHRFASTAWSMVFIALMYAYARVAFRSRRVGVLAAGLTAALWWPTLFGRLGLREISQAVMMTPALLALLLILRAESPRRAWSAAVVGGIFAGLTSYTFLSGRGYPAIVVLFLLYALVANRELVFKQWRAFTVYTGLMVAISVPLFVYIAMHPEFDFHVRDLSDRSWIAQGDLSGLVPQVLNTLGMFTFSGDQNWVRNIAGRPVFVGPEGVVFYLALALCVWRWRKAEYVLPLIVIATMLVPNVLAENPPRWTRSIGILPGLMPLTVLPVEWAWARAEQWLVGKPRRAWGNALIVIVVAAFGVSIYARTATDMFTVWLDNPNIYWMTLAYYDSAGNYIRRSPDTTPVNYVMDYYNDWRKNNVRRPALPTQVEMRWSVNNALILPNDPRGWRIAFQIVGAPARALLEAFLNLNAPIYIDPRADPDGQHPLHVYALARAQLEQHLVTARGGLVTLPNTRVPLTTPVQASDVLQFQGYEILNPQARPGEQLNVLTYWRVLQRPPEMAVFVHLLDTDQNVVAQYDGLDVVVDDLMPGDTIIQLHALTLPATLAAGDYHFEMGAYTRADLKRLPLNTGTDAVWLQTWTPAR